MKRLCCMLLLACLGPALARGQLAPGAGPATALRPSTAAESPAAPDWLVWRAFHSSLAFYSRESRDEVNAMLRQRAGLTDVWLVLNAGDRYLEELSIVDGAATRDDVSPQRAHVPAAAAQEPRNNLALSP